MESVFVKNYRLIALGILPAQPWGILPKKNKTQEQNPTRMK